MPIFCQQNVYSLKTQRSHVHILSKNINSLKKSALISFFQIYHEKPPAFIPIFGQKKRQFCENYTTLWAKNVNRVPFFSPIFHEKITAVMPIFGKKMSIL